MERTARVLKAWKCERVRGTRERDERATWANGELEQGRPSIPSSLFLDDSCSLRDSLGRSGISFVQRDFKRRSIPSPRRPLRKQLRRDAPRERPLRLHLVRPVSEPVLEPANLRLVEHARLDPRDGRDGRAGVERAADQVEPA